MTPAPVPDAEPAEPVSGRRRAVVWGLIALAALIGILSVLAAWVDRQALDEPAWRKASAELIQDPKIRSSVSTYLVDELYDNVNVAAELQSRLPEELKPLAGPASAALRGPATDAVERLLAEPRVQQLWIAATVAAQRKFINVVEDRTGEGISTGDGVVTVDLGELVRELGADLGLSSTVLDRLPPDAGQFVVMRSDQLANGQRAVHAVQVLDVVLLVLMLALLGLALYLARGFRREALRAIGAAFVLIGLTLLVARRLGGDYVVDSLAAYANRGAAHSVWWIGTGVLGDIGRASVLYGAVIIAAAVLAGPSEPAVATRRWMAPVLNERPAVAWGITAAVFLLLVLWGGTHALREPVLILLLAALVAAGVAALRRQTLREFPPAPPEPAPAAAPPPAPAGSIPRFG